MNTEQLNKQKARLKAVLDVQSVSKDEALMDAHITTCLSAIKGVEFYVDKKNIYATKGKLKKDEKYPCIVSHKDTVHDIIKNYRVYEVNGAFMAMNLDTIEQTGVGGDDKVGIFICLEMLMRKDVVKAVFFSDEEIGCVGSGKLDESFFKDVGYALQCDRKGYEDFVNEIGNMELFGKEFSNAIADTLKAHGYKEHDGGMTDVQSIKKKFDFCVANMSCGYYRPHTESEVVDIRQCFNTLDMVDKLTDVLGNKEWYHKYEPPVYKNQHAGHGAYGGYGGHMGGYGLNYGVEKSRHNEHQITIWDSEKREWVPSKSGKKNAKDKRSDDYYFCDKHNRMKQWSQAFVTFVCFDCLDGKRNLNDALTDVHSHGAEAVEEPVEVTEETKRDLEYDGIVMGDASKPCTTCGCTRFLYARNLRCCDQCGAIYNDK